MKTSEEIKELAEALALAQVEIRNPAADTENPFFHSSYADLAGGLEMIRGPLSKQGLSLIQATRTRFSAPAYDGGPTAFAVITTRLQHRSGQWIEEEMELAVPSKGIPTPQEFGSAFTYGRRYQGFAFCGLAKKGEDDDGNAASGKGDGQKKTEKPPVRPPAQAQQAPRPTTQPAPANGKSMSTRIKALNDAKALTAEDHTEIRNMIPKLVGADLEKFIAGWEKDLDGRNKEGVPA